MEPKPGWHTTLVIALLSVLLIPAAKADDSIEKRLERLELQLESYAAEERQPATGWHDNTRFGSYGELHLNKLKNRNPGGTDRDELDFHRFVLSMWHEFNERTRFFSELEMEHAVARDSSAGSSGVVALEQAYLDFTMNDVLSAKAGLMLMPVGIISETHEPPTFYGVERNPVETYIIPTTWREGGLALTAHLGESFTLDTAITGGLAATAARNYAVRDGRQHTASAKAKDAAYTARLKWSGIPGVELAGTVQYQSDISQSADAAAGAARLHEAHAVVNKGQFGLRALYASWHLDGNGPRTTGADRQNGWYVEPSWKFSDSWGVFARRSSWDNTAGDAAGSKLSQADAGVNFWPHPDVVVKLDHQNQKAPAGQDEFDGFNFGLGYQF